MYWLVQEDKKKLAEKINVVIRDVAPWDRQLGGTADVGSIKF